MASRRGPLSGWVSLVDVRPAEPDDAVIGVVGGCGGIGASRFAAVLATAAAETAGAGLLVDLDPAGGGLDVLLGIESVPGPRWSGLRLAGGVLDAERLFAGLPAWGRVTVLAADRFGLPPSEQVVQVVRAAALAAPVVVDLGRYPTEERTAAIACCGLVVVICACDLPAITAARVATATLGAIPVALVARGGRAAAAQAAKLIGAPLAARLPTRWARDVDPLDPGAIDAGVRRVARGLLAGLFGVNRPAPIPAVAAGWTPELS
jgi:hypothetical protein